VCEGWSPTLSRERTLWARGRPGPMAPVAQGVRRRTNARAEHCPGGPELILARLVPQLATRVDVLPLLEKLEEPSEGVEAVVHGPTPSPRCRENQSATSHTVRSMTTGSS
jgi:hypothetical protein